MHRIRLETCVEVLQQQEKESNNELLLCEAMLLTQEDVNSKTIRIHTENTIFKDDTQTILQK